MELLLSILGYSLFAVALILGLALDAVGLFGNVLIWCSVAGVYVATDYRHFGVWTLVILGVLVAIGEVLEAVAAGVGAKKFGGGRGAMLCSVAGCIVGAIFGTPFIPIPIVGTIAGACAGAFIGAMGYEVLVRSKDVQSAAKVGAGASLGKLGGIAAKLAVGIIMLVVAAFTF